MQRKARLAKQSVTAFLLVFMTGSLDAVSLPVAAHAAPKAAAAQVRHAATLKEKLALLDSIGTCPGSAIIREYVTGTAEYVPGKKQIQDVVGRAYAIALPSDEGGYPTAFYERRLVVQGGWKTFQTHAASSCWGKRNLVLCLIRSGPKDSGPPPGALLLKEAAPPANAQFFFSIEVQAE